MAGKTPQQKAAETRAANKKAAEAGTATATVTDDEGNEIDDAKVAKPTEAPKHVAANPFLAQGAATVAAEDGARVVNGPGGTAVPVVGPTGETQKATDDDAEPVVLPFAAQSSDGHWMLNVSRKWGPIVIEVTPRGWVGDAPVTTNAEELDTLIEVLKQAQKAVKNAA
jgi:hypothetical protein